MTTLWQFVGGIASASDDQLSFKIMIGNEGKHSFGTVGSEVIRDRASEGTVWN